MKNRDLLLLLLVIGAIGLFLWQLMQKTSKGVESLSAATAKAVDSAKGVADTVEQNNRRLSSALATIEAQQTNAPDFASQFDALLTTNNQATTNLSLAQD